MRITIGVFSVLGLSVTVGLAQPPAATPPRPRSAKLLPPEPLPPEHSPPVARAAAEELLPPGGMTPVNRLPSYTGPGLRTAAATAGVGSPQPVHSLTPQPGPGRGKDEPSLLSRGFDKLKGAFGSEKPTGPTGAASGAAAGGNGSAPANAAFRGTTANGSPVYAGPPAYRWYGYGSVTPGANPYAPAGQYPKASANWYTITGATPGAFPVPVMNPLRSPPGTEPPVYAATPGQRPPAVAAYPPAYPEPPRFAPAVDHRPPPAPPASPAPPIPIPTMPTVPVVMVPPAEQPVAPVTIPTLTPPPGGLAPLVPEMPTARGAEPSGPPATPAPLPTLPVTVTPVPAAEIRPVEPPAPTAPVIPATSPNPAPAALPGSVTDDQPKWQTAPEPPATGTWNPATKPQSSRTPATPPASAPQWEGAKGTAASQPVARGQVGDNRPDPVATLIQHICNGRASGVEIRWTGGRRVTASFECRTAGDAQQLVKEISARPELAPLQIDFCVTVK